jgi:nitrite reductase/ring-hydroxylating ferredoxin subunit
VIPVPLAEGEARSFETEVGEAGVVVHRGGRLYAYRNRCPHTGVELNWLPGQFLSIDGEHIQCATHGALFRIEDGLCVYGPCSGQSLQPLPPPGGGDLVCA